MLSRAQRDKAVVNAAQRALVTPGLAVPANVPAATRNQAKTTHRQPTKKNKTPR